MKNETILQYKSRAIVRVIGLLGVMTFALQSMTFAQGDPLWIPTGSLNIPLSGHTATLLANSKVLVVGDGDGHAELYDPATGVWRFTGSLNTARSFHTATRLPNGKVLVAGGYDASFSPLASAELYDPSTGAWSITGSLNIARSWYASTLLGNGKVLAVGGVGGDNSSELYDVATGTWSVTGALNSARYGHTATLLQNGKVLVAAGSNDSDLASALASAELYDPVTGAWSVTGNLNASRIFHTSTLLHDGKILVAGGYFPNFIAVSGGLSGASPTSLNSAELYDPTTGQWSFTTSLNTARDRHTATLLLDGKVLITAGEQWSPSNPPCGLTLTCLDFHSFLSSSELYDPAMGTWSSPGNLHVTRSGHTATLLPGGQVLVAGGNNMLSSTELGLLNPAKLLTLTADLTSPQNLGTSIAFTAIADGGIAPLQYRWWVFNSGMWSMVQDWSASNSFVWTPGVGGNYRVGVWIKSNGNPADLPEGHAYNSVAFDITPPPPLVLTAISTDQASPQPAGSTITFTAATTGGLAPLQYKWWVFNGVTWSVLKDWSTSNSFIWTAGVGGSYRIGVWVKNNLNPADAPEGSAYNSVPFNIDAPPMLRLTGINADQVSPQPAGSTINFSATTTGGLAPHQYKWWLFNGVSWSVLKDWSTSNSFAWTSGVGGNYRIGVWVKNNVNPADAPEGIAYNSVPFTINAAPVLMLTGISADQVSPQPAGSTINFTAATTGGLAPLQYKWWVFNGVTWSVAKDWSTSSSFSWTPGVSGNYHVGVWVKSNLNPADAPEGNAYSSVGFGVGLIITGLSADQTSPQLAGSAVTFTATASGGVAPLQYKWWVFDGVLWSVVKDWSTTNTLNWTAGVGGSYRIGVWAKSNLNSADAPEGNAFTSVAFTMSPDPACQGCWDY